MNVTLKLMVGTYDTAVLEVKKLQEQVAEMKTLLLSMKENKNWGGDTLEGSKFEKLGDTVVGEAMGESSSGRDE
jgi:hypothetical protein